jgi:hypothetical protein
MIEDVRNLCDRLTAKKPRASEFAASLGAMVEDPGEGMPIVVRQGTSPWKEARVTPDDEGFVESVDLVPSEAAVHLPAFVRAFGEGREVPMLHPTEPVRVAFELDPGPKHPATCTLFVAVENDGGSLDQARILSVTIRRDPR